MLHDLRLSLLPGTEVRPATEQRVIITTPMQSGIHVPVLQEVGLGLRTALERLPDPGIPLASIRDVHQQIKTSDGIAAVGRFVGFLHRLTQLGMIRYNLYDEETLFAVLVPVSPNFRMADDHVESLQAYVVSRFACLHGEGHAMVLESPLAHARIILHQPVVAASGYAPWNAGQ